MNGSRIGFVLPQRLCSPAHLRIQGLVIDACVSEPAIGFVWLCFSAPETDGYCSNTFSSQGLRLSGWPGDWLRSTNRASKARVNRKNNLKPSGAPALHIFPFDLSLLCPPLSQFTILHFKLQSQLGRHYTIFTVIFQTLSWKQARLRAPIKEVR